VPYTVNDRARNSYCSAVHGAILAEYHELKESPKIQYKRTHTQSLSQVIDLQQWRWSSPVQSENSRIL